MSVSEICRREVDLVDPNETAWAAAERMFRRGVGSLVVLDQTRRPIGIVTALDLVVRVIATERLPRTTRVRDIMTTPVITIPQVATVLRAFSLLRRHSLTRLPVVDHTGKLVGMLTLADVLSQYTGDPSSFELTEPDRSPSNRSPSNRSTATAVPPPGTPPHT